MRRRHSQRRIGIGLACRRDRRGINDRQCDGFAAYKAKAAETKAAPAADATIMITPNRERAMRALAEHATVIRRLSRRPPAQR
jgi:hypothetical protein